MKGAKHKYNTHGIKVCVRFIQELMFTNCVFVCVYVDCWVKSKELKHPCIITILSIMRFIQLVKSYISKVLVKSVE